jgi:hypothetical protein
VELADFDCLVLGLFLMAQFKGQLVIPDGGFYLRDAHLALIREYRLVVGVNFLDELPDKLRNGVMLMNEKVGRGATYDDAVELARKG